MRCLRSINSPNYAGLPRPRLSFELFTARSSCRPTWKCYHSKSKVLVPSEKGNYRLDNRRCSGFIATRGLQLPAWSVTAIEDQTLTHASPQNDWEIAMGTSAHTEIANNSNPSETSRSLHLSKTPTKATLGPAGSSSVVSDAVESFSDAFWVALIRDECRTLNQKSSHRGILKFFTGSDLRKAEVQAADRRGILEAIRRSYGKRQDTFSWSILVFVFAAIILIPFLGSFAGVTFAVFVSSIWIAVHQVRRI